MFHLYIKTHKKTGLKYLGQTKKDPYVYNGSGTYWMSHLKKHGRDIETKIIGTYDTQQDLSEAGKFYSKKYNIVKSKKWANLIPETGLSPGGGRTRWCLKDKHWLKKIEKAAQRSKEKETKAQVDFLVKLYNQIHKKRT